MIKKLLTIIIKHVLWPLLKVLLEESLRQLTQWIFEKIREFFRRWRKEEEEAASSKEAREAIRKKYDRREADLATLEQEVPDKVREIVRNAFKEADKQTDALISSSAKAPALKDVAKKLEQKGPKD